MLQNTFSSRPSRSCQQDTHLGYSFTYFRSSFCVFDYINEESATESVFFVDAVKLSLALSLNCRNIWNSYWINNLAIKFIHSLQIYIDSIYFLEVDSFVFLFCSGNLMVSIGTCKHGIFPIRRKLECATSSFQRFPQFFFLDLLMNQVNHYQICFLFFKLSRQGFCIFACFLLSLLGVAHNFVHLNVLEGFSVLG